VGIDLARKRCNVLDEFVKRLVRNVALDGRIPGAVNIRAKNFGVPVRFSQITVADQGDVAKFFQRTILGAVLD